MTLYVLKNEHYLNNLKNLTPGDTVILNNSISRFLLDFILEDYDFTLELINTFTLNELLEGKLDHMKFNYIIGNPPYQDGTKAGGQNKIYNLISKKCLNLLTDDGIINFITPSSVTRPSKRFTILNNVHLKSINFDVNKEFNVGVSICSWIIDKSKNTNKVSVIANNKEYIQSIDLIHNPELIDTDFVKLYKVLKSTNIKDRMFKSNNFGNALYNGIYKLYNSYDSDKVSFYSTKEPLLYKKNKFCVKITKSYNINNSFYDTRDYDLNTAVTECNINEIQNIQSFIYSDYFIHLNNLWKKYTAQGFSSILLYVPVFDKTKKWTNDEVKEFFKGLV